MTGEGKTGEINVDKRIRAPINRIINKEGTW